MRDDDVEAPLLSRKQRWQNHWVNGTGFTISMATSAVIFTGIVLLGASMLVAGTVCAPLAVSVAGRSQM